MKLIIGGAYQGKLSYAVEKYGFSQEELCDLASGFPAKEYSCYYHLEALTMRAAKEGLSADEIIKRLVPYMENAVIISREIGCGIVPIDPGYRLYREIHGMVLGRLATEASSVARVFCGLAKELK